MEDVAGGVDLGCADDVEEDAIGRDDEDVEADATDGTV